jgi:hypothetical protein
MDGLITSPGSREPGRVLRALEEPQPANRQPALIKNIGNICIRPATLDDLPRLANILVEATRDDDVFMHLYPKGRLYPRHYRDGLLRRLKLQHQTPGCILCVAVLRNFLPWRLKGNKKKEGVVVGYCAWQRIGDDYRVDKWKKPKTGFWNGKFCLRLLLHPVISGPPWLLANL